MREGAINELAEFYPADPDGARPIAYLWARTVRCETPNCGAELPLIRSFWLCKKASRKRALRCGVTRPRGMTPHVEFDIFEPKVDGEVPAGTVNRAKATGICCNTVLSPDRVRAQLREQRGGADVVFDEKGRRIGGARLVRGWSVLLGGSARTEASLQAADRARLRGRLESGSGAQEGCFSEATGRCEPRSE